MERPVEAYKLLSSTFSHNSNVIFSPRALLTEIAQGIINENKHRKDRSNSTRILPKFDASSILSSDKEKYQKLLTHSSNLGLQIFSTIFVDKNSPIPPEVREKITLNYASKIMEIDFLHDPEQSRQTINAEVSRETNGKIRNFLEEPIVFDGESEGLLMLLTEAVYFRSLWKKAFNEQCTFRGKFQVPGQVEEKTIAIMCGRHEYPYAISQELGGAQVLEMACASPELSAIFILPKTINPDNIAGDKIDELEKILTTETLAAAVRGLAVTRVSVQIPKFSLEMGVELKGILQKIEGISRTDACVGEVVQKCLLEIGEEGIEEADETYVEIRDHSAFPEVHPTYFYAVRPFLFILRYNSTGEIVLMGRISDPTANVSVPP